MDSNSNPNLSFLRPNSSRTPSSSSSSSTFSSTSSSSSPSPFHSTLLPSSSIPFSWEQQPGIPKSLSSTIPSSSSSEQNLLLPLPPPLTSASTIPHKKRFHAASVADPFTAALVECAKEVPDVVWWRRSDDDSCLSKISGICRRSVVTDHRFGFLDIFANFNCKASSCSVSDATTIVVPRARIRSGHSYGLLDRRSN